MVTPWSTTSRQNRSGTKSSSSRITTAAPAVRGGKTSSTDMSKVGGANSKTRSSGVME